MVRLLNTYIERTDGLGIIQIAKRKCYCRECGDIIYAGRERIRLNQIFGLKVIYNSYYCLHLDCYKKIVNRDMKKLEKHQRKINEAVTRGYLKEKRADLVLEKI